MKNKLAIKREETRDNLLNLWLCSDKYRGIRHLIPITILALVVNVSDYKESAQHVVRVIAVVFLLFVPYLNNYLLIPRLLFQKFYSLYIISALTTIMIIFFSVKITDPIFSELMINNRHTPYTFSDVLTFFVFMFVLLLASTGVKLFQHWIKETYQKIMIDNSNMKLEMDLLKKQISPHFLFNTLNNLDVLIFKDQQSASELVYKLSNLLRYQLYMTDGDKVMLSKEIDFINDFLYLEKLRHENLQLFIEEDQRLNHLLIHPLTLISFVENAVKHNDFSTNPYIHISYVFSEGHLIFRCENPKKIQKHTEIGGLGLKNIQRRLDLLYPYDHKLSIEETNDRYSVTLTLKA